MSDIDERIREALKGSDEGDELVVDQGLISEVIMPFRGKRKWVNTIGILYGVLGLALAIWAGFEFYHAEVVREQMLWGGLCLLGVLCNIFVKVFFWMEMHTNRVLRELKRVELLVLRSKE